MHIRLNMIVRDEGHVITRCLEAVKPFIDSWVIVDTGSVDDTQGKIRQALDQLPGELHEREWHDFGHNRTEALRLAREGADYLLLIDAEDTWEVDDGFEFPLLTADAYYVRMVSGKSWKLPMLVRASKPWMWRRKKHSPIVCDEPFSTDVLHGAQIVIGNDGARRSTIPAKEKYGADAEWFEKEVAAEPGNLRAMFYLAQSYRDAGDTGKAIMWYERRVVKGGWSEEVYQAYMELAELYTKMGSAWNVIEGYYLAAYQLAPHRAEPLVALSTHYRREKNYATAHLYACAAKELPYPDDLLWVTDSVYQWRALDEYAVTAQRIGKLEEAKAANQRLLMLVPPREMGRIATNLKWCAKTSS
jgi:glycosyltransferase involved in cell wall biosynthesis